MFARMWYVTKIRVEIYLIILSTNLFHVQLCSRFESLDKFGDFGAQSPILPIRALFSQHTDQSFHVDSEVIVADEIVNIGLEPRTINQQPHGRRNLEKS